MWCGGCKRAGLLWQLQATADLWIDRDGRATPTITRVTSSVNPRCWARVWFSLLQFLRSRWRSSDGHGYVL